MKERNTSGGGEGITREGEEEIPLKKRESYQRRQGINTTREEKVAPRGREKSTRQSEKLPLEEANKKKSSSTLYFPEENSSRVVNNCFSGKLHLAALSS